VLLKDYRPQSIYRIKVTDIKQARFPVIDCHHHAARTAQRVEQDLQIMDAAGLQSTVAFCPVGEGQIYRSEVFDNVCKLHSRYAKRFYVYAGLDLRGCDLPGWRPDAEG
jgi:hypothetical protein